MKQQQAIEKNQTTQQSGMKRKERTQRLSQKTDHPYMQTQSILGNHCVLRCHDNEVIQAKLLVGSPGDRYEQEADRVAEQVIRMPDLHAKAGTLSISPLQALHIRRQSPARKRELKLQMDQQRQDEWLTQERGNTTSNVEVNSDVTSSIQSLCNTGRSLPRSSREFFEQRLGHSFSGVRIHTDARAANVARDIKARAFTMGSDVVFAPGQYAPDTQRGTRLLAHELTHTVQQRTIGQCLQCEQAAIPVPPTVIYYTPSERLIREQDTWTILNSHLQIWRSAARFGVQNASIEVGDDYSTKWFLAVLAGNLIWAFAGMLPLSIPIGSVIVAGAVLGAGTIERLFRDNQQGTVGNFRSLAASHVNQTYTAIHARLSELTPVLTEQFYDSGLTDQDDAHQTAERDQVGWAFLFGNIDDYGQPGAIEESHQRRVETLWGCFSYRFPNPFYLHGFSLNEISQLAQVIYYQCLLTTGIYQTIPGVIRIYEVQTTPEGYTVTGERVRFPGGAEANIPPDAPILR